MMRFGPIAHGCMGRVRLRLVQTIAENTPLMTLVRACSPAFARVFAPGSFSPALSRSLARFPDSMRPKVTRLAATHRWLADLAVTFPGLLAALATASPGPARDRALTLLTTGAPLRDAARELGIPLWLRRLGPEAFPGRIPPLPLSDTFACRVANRLPAAPEQSAKWLAAVSEAWRVAGEPYALWIASRALDRRLAPYNVPRAQRRFRDDYISPIIGLGVFAWFSRWPSGPARDLIDKPWNPSLGPTDARKLASTWWERLELGFGTGGGLADVWLTPGTSMEFDFIPLRTAGDVMVEAAAMRNCIVTYGGSLGENYCRLWSIRRGGQRVATVEIYRNQDLAVPMIAQMKGPGNAEAPPEVWRALYAWLAAEPVWNVPVGDIVTEFIDRRVWHRVWLPYWRAMGLKPWLPVEPSRRALWQIMRTL